FLQLADAPQLRMDVLQWSRHHRLFPGQGAFDLPGFLGAVLAAGYAGPLSLEVFNDVFRQSDPARTAVDAMRSLLWLEESLAARGLESEDPGRSARRAEALCAPVLPRERGRTEADLSAVAAPDGTQLFFTRTGPDGWPADFLATGEDVGPGAGITGVDHVGLT